MPDAKEAMLEMRLKEHKAAWACLADEAEAVATALSMLEHHEAGKGSKAKKSSGPTEEEVLEAESRGLAAAAKLAAGRVRLREAELKAHVDRVRLSVMHQLATQLELETLLSRDAFRRDLRATASLLATQSAAASPRSRSVAAAPPPLPQQQQPHSARAALASAAAAQLSPRPTSTALASCRLGHGVLCSTAAGDAASSAAASPRPLRAPRVGGGGGMAMGSCGVSPSPVRPGCGATPYT